MNWTRKIVVACLIIMLFLTESVVHANASNKTSQQSDRVEKRKQPLKKKSALINTKNIKMREPRIASRIDLSKPYCTDQPYSFDCYEAFFTHVVNEYGHTQAYDILKRDYSTNDTIRTQCHPLTHAIGFAAGQKTPSIAEAFSHGDGFCWSGYYHGVMEAVIAKGGIRDLPKIIPKICSDLKKKRAYSFDHYNCVHGLGHGLMAVTQNDLFASLNLCGKLKNDSWERESCWSGVFMENIIIDNKNHFTAYLKPSEPLYPCTAVPDEAKRTCWLMHTSYLLKIRGGNFDSVFELCRTIDDQYQDTCFQSIGRDASGSTVSDPDKTRGTCLKGVTFREQSNCIIGAVKDFISYFHSDAQAKEFCASLDPSLQAVCVQTSAEYYIVF